MQQSYTKSSHLKGGRAARRKGEEQGGTANKTVQPPQGWRAPAEQAQADGKSKHFGSDTGQRPIPEAQADEGGGAEDRQPTNSAASVYTGQSPQWWRESAEQAQADGTVKHVSSATRQQSTNEVTPRGSNPAERRRQGVAANQAYT